MRKSYRSREVMRWFFLVFLVLWVFLVIGLAALVFYSTKNALSLGLLGGIAPPIIIFAFIARYLFRDEKDFDLEALKIILAPKQQRDKRSALQPVQDDKSILMQHLADVIDLLDHQRNKL